MEPPRMQPDTICLFLDVDGTLLDIAPRPEAVVVPAGLAEDLARASDALGGALALVSGRPIAQLDALFGALRLPTAGVHGAELRLHPGGSVEVSSGTRIPDAVRDDLRAILTGFPGTVAEDKVYSVAVHYRAVPAVAVPLARALAALAGRHPDAALVLLQGRCVIEIKRPGFDKGSAVRRFLAHPPFAGRRPVVVGDDMTDHPGFVAAVAAGGQAFGVGRTIPGATATLPDPPAVRRWLQTLTSRESILA